MSRLRGEGEREIAMLQIAVLSNPGGTMIRRYSKPVDSVHVANRIVWQHSARCLDTAQDRSGADGEVQLFVYVPGAGGWFRIVGLADGLAVA